MELVHCVVRLGGEVGNTVPKMNVTVAELAVLRLLHGEDAIVDIEPAGSVNRPNRVELERLRQTYRGRPKEAQGDDQRPASEHLFPGVAARVYETLDELELPETVFKPVTRAAAGKSRVDLSREVEAAIRGDDLSTESVPLGGPAPLRDEDVTLPSGEGSGEGLKPDAPISESIGGETGDTWASDESDPDAEGTPSKVAQARRRARRDPDAAIFE